LYSFKWIFRFMADGPRSRELGEKTLTADDHVEGKWSKYVGINYLYG
jgi:hypothetical protein